MEKVKLDIYESRLMHKIDILDEADFIKKLESTGIEEADNKCFLGEEGVDYEWTLRIAYDDKEIVGYGSNAIPKSFITLFAMLGCETILYEKDIVSGVVMQGLDRVNLFCRVRGRNRTLADLWDEEDSSRNKYSSPYFNPFYDHIDGISEVSIEELDEKINELGEDQEIKPGMLGFDPAFYKLEVTDKNGKLISFNWSDDDIISDGLRGFVKYLGKVIGDVPSKGRAFT